MKVFITIESWCNSEHTTNDGTVLRNGFNIVAVDADLATAKSHLHEVATKSIDIDLGTPDDWDIKNGMIDDDRYIVETKDGMNAVLCFEGEAYSEFNIREAELGLPELALPPCTPSILFNIRLALQQGCPEFVMRGSYGDDTVDWLKKAEADNSPALNAYHCVGCRLACDGSPFPGSE